VLALATFLFFVRFYEFWAHSVSIPQIFTARLRYFIPLLGMLMIPTIAFYEEWRIKLTQRISHHPQWNNIRIAGIIFILVAIAGGTMYAQAQHQKLLDSRSTVLDIIHTNVPTGSSVIGSADDCVYFTPYFSFKEYHKVTAIDANATLAPNTYVLDVAYATQTDNGSDRQDVIDAERHKIKDFLAAHQRELVKVFEQKGPSTITIWKIA
jgi:hypothetical protein